MENRNIVCAIIDTQGFFINKVFYPREVAIVNENLRVCFEIDCEFPRELTIKSFKHFTYQQNVIHGIPVKKVINDISFRVLKFKYFKNFITYVYECLKSPERPFFAVKNQQLSLLLKEYKIPFINLEDEKIGNEICPTLTSFDKVYGQNTHHCLLHFLLKNSTMIPNYRCSLRKASYIWEWLNMKYKSDWLYMNFDLLKDKEIAIKHHICTCVDAESDCDESKPIN